MKAEFKLIGRLKTIVFRVQKTEFRLITALFSRANFKASVEETLGAARPPDLRQGGDHPGPTTGDITLSR